MGPSLSSAHYPRHFPVPDARVQEGFAGGEFVAEGPVEADFVLLSIEDNAHLPGVSEFAQRDLGRGLTGDTANAQPAGAVAYAHPPQVYNALIGCVYPRGSECFTRCVFDDDVVGAFVYIVKFFFQQHALLPAKDFDAEGARPLQISLAAT